MTLSQRWKEFATRLGLPSVFNQIETVYRRPPGWYHTIDHVQACLEELDRVRDLADNPDAVELALWFHDAIYDPRAKDNEQRSAAFIRTVLSHQMVEEAERLIIATTHSESPGDPNAMLIVDVDLSILGKPEDTFDLYERQIRIEYDWVPEADYCLGRAKILQAFLDRPTIYSLEPIRQRYEEQARSNLTRSLSRLS